MADTLWILPKNFRKYGKSYLLFALREIFLQRSLDARGGDDEEAALVYSTVDRERVRCLLDLVADYEAESRFEKSKLALHAAAGGVEAARELLEFWAGPIRDGNK